MSPAIGYGSYHISQISGHLNSVKLIWLVYWNVSHFDLLVLVLNKNHVDIKIDREKFTHHYCHSNPIQSEMVHCVWNRNTTLVLWIYYVVLNGSHHVAAATWRESKNFFPLFSFSSPSSPMCHAQQLQLLWEQWKRREEQLMLFSLFFKTIDLSNCCQDSSLGGAVYTCSCNVLRGLA